MICIRGIHIRGLRIQGFRTCIQGIPIQGIRIRGRHVRWDSIDPKFEKEIGVELKALVSQAVTRLFEFAWILRCANGQFLFCGPALSLCPLSLISQRSFQVVSICPFLFVVELHPVDIELAITRRPVMFKVFISGSIRAWPRSSILAATRPFMFSQSGTRFGNS